jgi:hypothetical protein
MTRRIRPTAALGASACPYGNLGDGSRDRGHLKHCATEATHRFRCCGRVVRGCDAFSMARLVTTRCRWPEQTRLVTPCGPSPDDATMSTIEILYES